MRPLALILTLLCSLSATAADLFQWSEPAEHHQSAVVVRAGNAGGSGVYVKISDGVTGVLTCQHVVEGNAQARVQWTDGTWTEGEVWTDRTKQDSAFISTTHATIPPLAIAADPPAQGERVEYLGFGGPAGRTLRPHWGQVLGYRGRDISTTAPVISGDSGGCILNERREVVGLSAYGSNTVATVAGEGGPWSVYRPSGGPALPSLQEFVARVATRMQCGPSGCGPSGGGYMIPGSDGGSLYPIPDRTPRQKPDLPAQPQPPPMVEIDYQKIYAQMLEKMAADPRFRGPAGADGKDGQPGANGNDGLPGKDGADGAPGPAGHGPTAEQIAAAVQAYVEANPEAVASLVAPHLPPIYFRKVNAATGAELAPPEPIRLGEGFTFLLTPGLTQR